MRSLFADWAYGVDPARFAQAAGWTPDDWQADVLRSTATRLLLLASRQSGKSTTVATLAVHTAIYEPGALVLLLSPTLRQSGELLRKCLDVYQAIGRSVDDMAEAESKLSLELENGSRILSLPGREGTVRGYSSVRLLCVDEAAYVPDELIAAARPMLAVSGGRLVALSTPWGRRGWFWQAWSGPEDWARWEVPASRCPRIPPAFLEEERRALGPLLFASQYEVQFVDPEGSLFRAEDVQRALKEYDQWDLSKYLRPSAPSPSTSG